MGRPQSFKELYRWEYEWKRELAEIKQGKEIVSKPYILGHWSLLKRSLEEKNVRKMLEIGCGTGRLSLRAVMEVGIDVVSVDVVLEALEITKYLFEKNGLKADLVLADALSLPLKAGSFDMVYSEGLIEHFNEPEVVLKEHVRVAKRGGMIQTSVPNLFSWRFVRCILSIPKRRHLFDQKYFIRSSFKKALLRVGISDISLDSYALYQGLPHPLRKIGKLFRFLGRLIPALSLGFMEFIGKGVRP